jgi:hypothetical protein
VDFSPIESVALSAEIDAASSLLRHGFAILEEYRFASRDAEPVFACMAGGVEKLLKVTFGVATVDDGRGWPSKATMKNAGHKIVELDATVRGIIAEQQSRSTAPGLIRDLLQMTDGHPGVVQVLATLERYAVSGRFYNLDLLGGLGQPGASPQELWNALEMDIVAANPEMLDQLAGPEYENARQNINGILAWCLGMWCELVLRAWTTGVFGAVAQQWSPQLNLGHPPPRIKHR